VSHTLLMAILLVFRYRLPCQFQVQFSRPEAEHTDCPAQHYPEGFCELLNDISRLLNDCDSPAFEA
jgi:hypothetical protein